MLTVALIVAAAVIIWAAVIPAFKAVRRRLRTRYKRSESFDR